MAGGFTDGFVWTVAIPSGKHADEGHASEASVTESPRINW